MTNPNTPLFPTGEGVPAPSPSPDPHPAALYGVPAIAAGALCGRGCFIREGLYVALVTAGWMLIVLCVIGSLVAWAPLPGAQP